VIIAIVVAIIAVAVYLGIKAFTASNNIFQGNFFGITQKQDLKKDANGRSNFLIVGTSEDDPGHEAGYLTDSIMIMSIDQEKKDMYMFSIPRDLYVEYGMPCLSGYRGKINEFFSCTNDGTDSAAEQDRLAKTQSFIGGIVGLDIQYGIHVNYTVMRDVVNAIGGSITVTINSRDPRGVMDSNFDWKCGKYAQRRTNCPPDGHFIQYPNGTVTIDAEHALYLAQARGDIAPTYGFEQSNFDRERNQQMIAVAIRDKAMSAGTLTNLGKITGLIDALGNNLRTNIKTEEIRTIMDLAQNIPNESIKSLDLYSDDNPIFTTGTIPGAGSSVYPAAGVGVYSELQAYIAKQLTSNPVSKEGAKVVILNGTNEGGVAQKEADALTTKGYTISAVDNAPEGTYGAVEIYKIGEGFTATTEALKNHYGITTIKTTAPPLAVNPDVTFVVVIGKVRD
jgi:anionic cell wall polymer biosynthesis LytR-Cps2A-Psr (LCP) family protein